MPSRIDYTIRKGKLKTSVVYPSAFYIDYIEKGLKYVYYIHPSAYFYIINKKNEGDTIEFVTEGKFAIPFDLIRVQYPKKIYTYKGNIYEIVSESSIKIGGEWIEVVIYDCLYENPDGKRWVRFKKEFYELFKLTK